MKHFRVEEQIIPGQHIREYPNATRHSQEDTLRLAVKHYAPVISRSESATPITIIAAHANGFPKEMYEPMWDDLWEVSMRRNFAIRGVWFADSSHQGASGVMNETVQGDDPSYFDHSRDMLVMINHFREHMQRPLVGIAHSMGCVQIVNLSLIHPRLFTSLILLEPVIQSESATRSNPALMATLRPDLWKSRAEAETSMRAMRMFRGWDERMLDKFLLHAFRDTPTALYPEGKAPPGAVTLTTTKHQEAWSYVRENFEPLGNPYLDRLLVPDMDAYSEGSYLFFRPECLITLGNLPFVRPSVMYVFGAKSPMAKPEWIEEKMRTTGTGPGGSGGTQAGRVEKIVYEDAGHFVPCEKTKEVCGVTAEWLDRQIAQYRHDEEILKQRGTRKSSNDMLTVSEEWVANVKKPSTERRSEKAKI